MNELREKESTSLKSFARWFDRYARRIDELSVRNVDERAIEYGQYIADRFRDISGTLLVGEQNRFEARNDVYDDSRYRYNYRGYRNRYNRRYDQRNRRRQEGNAARQGGFDAQEMMREIDSKTAELRKALEQEYEIDF